MIYTALTNKAMEIAYEAHHGQHDVSGTPYIFHPFCVAEQMEDEISVCAALLHDVVEDTNVTLEDLEKEFPKEVTEVVALLTHTPDMTYREYLERLKSNETARKVKLADLWHNSDETRFHGAPISQERLLYFREKYKNAKKFLLEEDDDKEGWT